MKKTLVALTIALSSCISQPHKCPDDEHLLKAGFYLMSALREAESDKPRDIKIAESLYEEACRLYFSDCEENHDEKHVQEALEKTFDYLNLKEKEKTNLMANLRKINNNCKN